uniref:Uncharacterized protein n=1 Tax=Daucus carota subsp. sativus TaxID=79200 RepID=A0A162AJ85_DAUCS
MWDAAQRSHLNQQSQNPPPLHHQIIEMFEKDASQASSKISSPLGHFPRDQRGLAEFPKELTEMFGTSHHPSTRKLL